jgi:hypothetical protein
MLRIRHRSGADGLGTQLVARPAHVRDGSFASILARPGNVRFTHDSDQKADVPGCPKSANHVTSYCGKTASLFDYLVGAGEQRRRNGETVRLRGLEVDSQFELGLREPCATFANSAKALLRLPIEVCDFAQASKCWRTM